MFTPWRKLKKGKRFRDHRAIKIQADLEFNKLSNASKKTTAWNFNNPQSWNKFHELTKSEQLFGGVWSPNSDTETCYRQWKRQLNSVLGKCFSKKRIVHSKQSHNKEIRELLKSRGQAKKELSRQSIIEGKQKHLSHRIKKPHRLIDIKISDFNSQVIMEKIGFVETIIY